MQFSLMLAAVTIFLMSFTQKQFIADEEPSMSVPAINYGNWACTTEAGEDGCECTDEYTDPECSLITECTASSDLVNYDAALNSMFTEAQIQLRAANGVPITEPALINALISDGWPIVTE